MLNPSDSRASDCRLVEPVFVDEPFFLPHYTFALDRLWSLYLAFQQGNAIYWGKICVANLIIVLRSFFTTVELLTLENDLDYYTVANLITAPRS